MNKRPPRNGEIIKKIQNTLLVDGNALFKTGYFAAKNEYNSKGEHIGGILSFFSILRKVLSEDLYHRVYVFWDGNFSGKLRYDIYEDYKGDRGKDFINGTHPIEESELRQRARIWTYLNEMYVRQIKDEIVESDDFIAYYCLNKKENEKITIISSDRDFLQLLTDDVRIYFLDLKKYIDLSNYREEFNYHYSNAVLVKMMTGDKSDTIKGIKGLGEPTLLKHFPEIGEGKITLDEIIESAKKQQEERIAIKKPLKILNNIINKVTDGVQKERIYEINECLVDLSNPMITEGAIRELKHLTEGTLDSSGRELKNVFEMMKEDELNVALGSTRYATYLDPFKELIPREQKFIN